MVRDSHLVLSAERAGLEEVQLHARRLGSVLVGGDLVVLEGPLGAGKTTFVRAIAESLGVTDTVRSPSFTLANVYAGRVVVHHLDLYRLEQMDVEDALALEEYRSGDAVTLVEWPETGMEQLGSPSWRVLLGHDSPGARSLRIWALSDEGRGRWEESRQE